MPEIFDLKALRSHLRAGGRAKYLFFWGHEPAVVGRLDEACLSQWWPCELELDGVHYPSAEHYMMAEKARLFGDGASLDKIISARHPGEAKHFGRQVAGFNETVWQQHRVQLVFRGNLAKFGQDDELKRYLLSTKSRILVEASPVDRIWGIGLAADNPKAVDPGRWRGLNLLGFELMRVRGRLMLS